ncbi:hypothetical protein MJH54_29700, partial [Salmonella enterica subsp. enterica serovar Montevideo]|nr:hypothetical protein [Salmonella enterica subsp. enterica serovar Montevideo]
ALLNPEVYDQLRFWQAGSLDIRSLQTLKVALAPVVIAGIVALGGRFNLDTIRYDYYLDDNVAFEAFKAGAFDLRLENDAKNWATR